MLLSNFTGPRTSLYLALAFAFLLSLGSLGKDFNTDDLLILSNIETTYPEKTNSFDIYSSLIEHLDLPWWSVNVESSFFRPVSALLLRLDHAAFGRNVFLWRLHSLLWVAVFLVLAQRLYRHGFPQRVGGLALILLALDESLAFTSGWIANRHALVAAAFGCAALVAHRRWRHDGWTPGAALALLAYAASLAAGETGLAFLGYGFCYETLGRRGAWRDRIAGGAAMCTLLVSYVALYKVLGHGTRGGSIYVDPGSEPVRFVATALYRIPMNLAGMLAALPPEPFIASKFGNTFFWLGLVATLITAWMTYKLWPTWSPEFRLELSWCLPGAALSLIPLAAVHASHRQLLTPWIGVAPLVAAFLIAAWQAAKERRGWTAWPVRAALAFLVLAHLVVAPLVRVALEQGLDWFHRSIETPVAALPDFDEPKDLILIKIPGLAIGLYGRSFYDEGHDVNAGSWSYLSTAPVDHELRRIDDRTIEIRVIGGEMLTEPEALFWSRREELTEGRTFTTEHFEAQILELGEVGPVRMRYHFFQPLERDDLYLASWVDGKWVEMKLPQPGDSMVIRHTGSADSIMGS